MIQPLRRAHRSAFLVLGVALPAVFIGGLLARHPTYASMDALRNDSMQNNAGTEFEAHSGSANFKMLLLEGKETGPAREFHIISAAGFLAPDVYVYWSRSKPGTSIDSNATLLGPLVPQQPYTVPSDAAGYFVLYSVAQGEVLGSTQLEPAK
jgi:hypothetical protein